MDLRPSLLALALLAATVAATPAPSPTPAPAPPPQDATRGFDVTVSNMLQAEANGPCHMTYLDPALKVEVGGRRVVWACVR